MDQGRTFPSPIGVLINAYSPSVARSPSKSQFEYSDKVHSAAIRLIRIEPGGAGDTLNLSICTVPMTSAPAYIALSYTWGDPQHTCLINCEGKELYVTQNLKDALWQLRQSLFKVAGLSPIWGARSRLPYFWVDAICINQRDDEEKSHQVALMWEIYSRAELVIAWLGKQNEQLKRGVELIRHMSSMVGLPVIGADATLSNEQRYPQIRLLELTKLGLPSLISPAWNDLFSVLSRDWFSRVWVIQEFVAAKTFIFLCGDEFIDPLLLLRIGKAFEGNKLLSSIRNFDRNRVLAVNVDCLANLTSKAHDFNTLLWSTHLFKASDQRDRIFSLVHMAAGLKSNFISDLIDYRLSVHQVLVKCASISLAQDSLDVLCYAQTLGDLYSLPSWVPRWTAQDFCYTPLIRSCSASTQTLVATEPSQYYEITPNDTLVLKGKIFDRIEKIIKAPRPQVYDEYLKDVARSPVDGQYLMKMVLSDKAEDTQNLLNFQMECFAEIRKLFQYPTGESLPHLYWRTYFMDDQQDLPQEIGQLFEQYIGNMNVDISVLNDLPLLMNPNATDRFNLIVTLTAIATWSLSGTVWKGFTPKSLYHLSRLLICISSTLLTCSLLKGLRRQDILNAIQYRSNHTIRFLNEHLDLFTKAHNRLSGRNFCLTESGHVGWVSLYAKEGDGICVFRGCRFPFAVRECGIRHRGQYRLRGDVYLHGLMGENLFNKARVNVEDVILV